LSRAAAVALLLVAACTEAASPRDRLGEVWTPEAPGEPVVARVNETPIVTSEVRLRRATRDGGPVLDDLIVEDLLAAEAKRQGLLGDPKVRDAARRAMVQRLLEREFEAKVKPADVPEGVLRRAYRNNYWFFNRPEIREFEHFLVWATPKDTPQRQAASRHLAGEILRAVLSRRSAALADLRAEIEARGRAAGVKVQYERTRGVRSRLEKDFADLLWALAPGQIGARVAQSRYGFHVLRSVRVEPEVSRPFEAVREEVRERVWTEWREMRFKSWVADLRARHGAKVAEEALLLFRAKPPGVPAR
jgi:peptidyl-prolyl cis-trans isomerase C